MTCSARTCCVFLMSFVDCDAKCHLPLSACMALRLASLTSEYKNQSQLAGLRFRLTHLGQQAFPTPGLTKATELGKSGVDCVCLVLAKVNRGPIFPRLSGSLLTFAKKIA